MNGHSLKALPKLMKVLLTKVDSSSAKGKQATSAEVWSQLEQSFIESGHHARKSGHKIQPEVVSTYAYGFSVAKQGSSEFWRTVWDNAQVSTLEGSIHLGNALFDAPS